MPLDLPTPGPRDLWGHKLNVALEDLDERTDPATLAATIAAATNIPWVSANFAQLARSVGDLPAPFFIGHRGGGASIAPDGSIEGMQLGYDLGVDALEPDLVALADGALGVMHDATVDRTTTATGNAADLTAAAWRNLTLDITDMPGWPVMKAPTWSDIVAKFGGRVVLFPETKSSGGAVDGITRTVVAAQNAGILQSCVFASFDWDACVAAATLGAPWVAYACTAGDGTSRTPAALSAAGIKFITTKNTVTQATVTAMHAAGVKVIVYTDRSAGATVIDSRVRVAAELAKGVDGFYVDDPVYAAGRVSDYRRTTAPWTINPQHYHGHQAYTNAARGTYIGTAGAYRWQPSGGSDNPVLMGFACPLPSPTAYTLTVPIRCESAGTNAARWAGVYFGAASDAGVIGDVPNSNLVFLRQNGQMSLYVNTTLIGSVSTAAWTAATEAVIKIDVTPTQITVTRTDTGNPAHTLTVANSTNRGAYVFMRNNAFDAENFDVSFGAIALT